MDEEFKEWLENASDEDISETREHMRQVWMRNGLYEDAMHEIDQEVIERLNKKYREEHPDSKPRYREHGFMLPNDEP